MDGWMDGKTMDRGPQQGSGGGGNDDSMRKELDIPVLGCFENGAVVGVVVVIEKVEQGDGDDDADDGDEVKLKEAIEVMMRRHHQIDRLRSHSWLQVHQGLSEVHPRMNEGLKDRKACLNHLNVGVCLELCTNDRRDHYVSTRQKQACVVNPHTQHNMYLQVLGY